MGWRIKKEGRRNKPRSLYQQPSEYPAEIGQRSLLAHIFCDLVTRLSDQAVSWKSFLSFKALDDQDDPTPSDPPPALEGGEGHR